MKRVVAAAQRKERGAERFGAEREIAEVVAGLVEEIAPVDEREDHVADLEEITGVREEHLPLAQCLGRRLRARLLVDPGVVQLRMQQRPLEPFDDLELRIEACLDRELPQERLAERVDGLRSEEVDTRELRAARAARSVVGWDLHQRMGRVRRPRDGSFVWRRRSRRRCLGEHVLLFRGPRRQDCRRHTQLRLDFGQRGMDAVGDLSRRLLGECHQHDALGREVLVGEHQLQHFADDCRRLPGAGARFDDEVAAPRRRGRGLAAEIEERLLESHERSSCCSKVRGSRSCATAYFSSASCLVRQE